VPVGDDFDSASGAAVGALQLASQKLSFNADQASPVEVLAGEVGELTPGKPVGELGVARAGGGDPDRREELATSPGYL
jgi:hypothetical protein